MSSRTPRQVAGLEVHDTDDGLVIYQMSADRVHYLNPSAAVIFELCTGEHTAEQIVDLVRIAWELDAPPSADVDACLAQLRGDGLVA